MSFCVSEGQGNSLWGNLKVNWGISGGSVVPNLPAKAGNMGSIPRLERSRGEGNATHSSILARKISWTEEPGRPCSMVSQRVDTIEHTHAESKLQY